MRGTHRILKRKDPDSFYAAVAADGDFGDGVNPVSYTHLMRTTFRPSRWFRCLAWATCGCAGRTA